MNRNHSAVGLCVLAGALVCAACSSEDTSGTGGAGASTSGGTGGSGNTGNTGNTGGTGNGGNTGGSGNTGNTGGGPPIDNCTVFPGDNAWNTDISGFAVHANSDNFIDSIGRTTGMHADFGTVWDGAPIGIPFVVVPGTQPPVPINFTDYGDESDPGPYPVPPDAPIEGGPQGDGDRHVLVVDGDNCMLYEMFNAWPQNNGASWDASSGAVWDLSSNATRTIGWTSADAAGLPIFPGLARYEEVVGQGVVNHALRFTVSQSQSGYVLPATHYASSNSDPNLPPMGLRLRMKASYDCSALSAEVQVLCTAFKTYGLIVADNGSDWFVSGAPDPNWSDDNLHDIDGITGDAFEVVDTGPVQTY
jgi:hypothetical protein